MAKLLTTFSCFALLQFPQHPINMPDGITQLPFRLSEASFRRYESHLKAATIAYPKAVTFTIDPEFGVNPNTFAARLRDAKLSCLTYHWDTDINREILQKIAICSPKNNTIRCGPVEALKTTDKLYSPSFAADVRAFDLGTISISEAQLIARLASERLILCRIQFTLPYPEAAEQLLAFDIILDKQLDNSFIIS